MKRGLRVCFLVFFVVFGMFFVFDASNAEAEFGYFVGDWACSSYMAEGPHGGSIAGVTKISIDSWLNVFGSGFALLGFPGEKDQFVSFTTKGKVLGYSDGFVSIEGAMTHAGLDPIAVKMVCIGMSKSAQDGFQEMQCIEAQEDPLSTGETVNLFQCKRVFSK